MMEKIATTKNNILQDMLLFIVDNADYVENIENDKKMIMHALANKSVNYFSHSKRTSKLAKKLAQSVNLDKDTIRQISLAALMHDIGKLGISDEILNSKQKLTSLQFEKIKTHSLMGSKILNLSNDLEKISQFVLEHHERWDGQGYPNQISGEQICLPARIIALADSYDAMTSNRPYRKALSKKLAVEEIKRCSGTQFDLSLAKIFVKKVLRVKW
ncbi:MAG: HD domain-containing protein [Clostridia bacterium]|nr:HD domain-containing protein [Clostridia bacterium]